MTAPSANPYSAALLQGPAGRDPSLVDFVRHWDRVETLVVDVYRRAAADPVDEAEWRQLRAWFDEHPRPPGEEPVEPTASWAAGPFAAVLRNRQAAGFVANRAALQALPAAREALNRRLLAAGTPGAGLPGAVGR